MLDYLHRVQTTQDKFIKPLIPLTLLTLAASGCSLLGEKTEAYELVTGDGASALCTNGDDLWFFDQDAAIVGPHFSLALLCHHAGAAIPEALAAAEGLGELPEAAGDVEWLVNQFALAPELVAESQVDPDDPAALESEAVGLAAWIEAGEERIELDAVPAPGAHLAVAVPEGEDAVLWVEEDGRAQGLSLRSGERVDPVAAYYDGRTLGPVMGDEFGYEEVAVANGDNAWRLTCGSSFVESDRSAWRPEEGWAEPGTVFLDVRFNWCSYADAALRWNLDESALTVQAGGEPVAATAWSAEELPDTDGTMRYTAVFAVPEDAAGATLVFTPVGDLENLDGGDGYAFVDTPAATERELVF